MGKKNSESSNTKIIKTKSQGNLFSWDFLV